jgi:hypothetical protein
MEPTMSDYSSFYRYEVSLEEVQKFEMVKPQLDAMRLEFNQLKAKKPEAPVSKTKIKMVNAVLKDALELLDRLPESKYLALLDEDDIPQVSDVAMLLSQFEKAMSRFEVLHKQNSRWFLNKVDAKKVGLN